MSWSNTKRTKSEFDASIIVVFSLSSPNLDGSNKPGVSTILMFLLKLGCEFYSY